MTFNKPTQEDFAKAREFLAQGEAFAEELLDRLSDWVAETWGAAYAYIETEEAKASAPQPDLNRMYDEVVDNIAAPDALRDTLHSDAVRNVAVQLGGSFIQKAHEAVVGKVSNKTWQDLVDRLKD